MLVTQTFKINGTWIAPAGCTTITATAVKPNMGFGSAIGATSDSPIYFTTSPAGSLYACGNNTFGELGIGTVQGGVSSPTLVIGGYTWQSVVAGQAGSADTVLAISSSGAAYGWGYNANGQAGINSSVNVSSPTLVIGGHTWQKLFNNGICSFGISSTGSLYSWGANNKGGAGNNTAPTINNSSPTLVVGGLLFKDIQTQQGGEGSTNSPTMGLTWSGQVYGWGGNTTGSLGTGTILSYSSPTLVIGGYTFQKIGFDYSGVTAAGLTTSGSLYTWGYGANGQLGNNTSTTAVSSPVLVLGGYTFVDFAIISNINGPTGNSSIIGITDTGLAYAWGINVTGQLGTGTVIPVSSPTLVIGGYTWQQILGIDFEINNAGSTLGLATNGNLYGWGYNGGGQLGIGTSSNTSSPTLVVEGFTWQKILGQGYQRAHGLANGNIYSWGSNSSGELGINSSTFTESPKLVVGQYQGSFSDVVTTITIPVVAGATYNVQVGPSQASVGGSVLATGFVDRIVITYSQ